LSSLISIVSAFMEKPLCRNCNYCRPSSMWLVSGSGN